MDVRVGHRRARHHDRRDGEGVGAGGQDQRAAGDGLRVGGVAGDRGDRGGRREREARAGAQRHAARGDAAGVSEGKSGERVRRTGRQAQDAAAFDGDGRAGVDGTGGVDIDLRTLVLPGAHDGEAAGRKHDVAHGRRGEGQGATIDLRAAGEIVRGGEDDGIGTVLDQAEGRAGAVIPDQRVDREGVLGAEDDQLAHAGSSRTARGDHAARRGRAERRGVVIVATEEAALLEVEHVAGSREGEIERRARGEPERTRGGAARRQGKGAIVRRSELGDLAGAEVAVVTEEAALAYRADAEGEIIGGVVTRVGNRPRTEEAAEYGRRRGVEEKSDVVAGLAELLAAGEIDHGARIAGQRSEGDVVAVEDAAATGAHGDERARVQGERSETLGGVRGDPPVHHDLAAAQEHRRLIPDAVVVLDLQVAVVKKLETPVVDDEFGNAGEGTVVAEVEGTAGVDEAPAERGGRLEIDGRPAASTEEIQRISRELAREGVIPLTIEDEVGGGGRSDGAAGAGGKTEAADASEELRTAVEVERGAFLDVDRAAVSLDRVELTRAHAQRAAGDRDIAAHELTTAELQRARSGLEEGVVRNDASLEIEGSGGGDLHHRGGEDRDGDEARTGGRGAEGHRGGGGDGRDEGAARDTGAADGLTDGKTRGRGQRQRRGGGGRHQRGRLQDDLWDGDDVAAAAGCQQGAGDEVQRRTGRTRHVDTRSTRDRQSPQGPRCGQVFGDRRGDP